MNRITITNRVGLFILALGIAFCGVGAPSSDTGVGLVNAKPPGDTDPEKKPCY